MLLKLFEIRSCIEQNQNFKKIVFIISVKCHQVDIHLNWVPGHMNIKGNELADQAAKKETELQKINTEKYIFFSFIKRKIKESVLIK